MPATGSLYRAQLLHDTGVADVEEEGGYDDHPMRSIRTSVSELDL